MGQENEINELLEALAEAKEAGDKSAARKIRVKLRKAGYSLRAQNGNGKAPAPAADAETTKRNRGKRKKAEEVLAGKAGEGKVTLVLEIGKEKRTFYLKPGRTITISL